MKQEIREEVEAIGGYANIFIEQLFHIRQLISTHDTLVQLLEHGIANPIDAMLHITQVNEAGKRFINSDAVRDIIVDNDFTSIFSLDIPEEMFPKILLGTKEMVEAINETIEEYHMGMTLGIYHFADNTLRRPPDIEIDVDDKTISGLPDEARQEIIDQLERGEEDIVIDMGDIAGPPMSAMEEPEMKLSESLGNAFDVIVNDPDGEIEIIEDSDTRFEGFIPGSVTRVDKQNGTKATPTRKRGISRDPMKGMK